MIERKANVQINQALSRQAAVVLIGPRQVGKTTLALDISEERPAQYLDLESASDRVQLSEPRLFLEPRENVLVIMDEIHRVPDLFAELRGLIDRGRRKGIRHGRFLMLGSASPELLKQSQESLAGRIEHVEMTGLTIGETGGQFNDQLWLRGGLPDSFLAASDNDSLAFRINFLRSYFERDIPQLGWKIPADTLNRLWIMLAHSQGQLLNASTLAKSLDVSVTTIIRYLGLLVDLLLVRRLSPYSANIKKRLVKSPKFYIRDSGLVHALLGLETADQLAAHPVVGASWEGHAIENILNSTPPGVRASFYRTADGAEIDLILELPSNHGLWAIEIKRSLAVKLSKGFHSARSTLNPMKTFVIHASEDEYPLPGDIEVVGLEGMCRRLQTL